VTAPLVSCVVPVFNGERHLGAALDSILAQTHRPLEVIVVDDGSADRSVQVAEAHPEPVRVIRQANAGPSAARNRGVREARGELVGFLDADDLWLPEKLEAQIAHLAAHPELEATCCLIENFWEDEVAAEEPRWRAHGRVVGSYVMQTLLARRELLERVPFDETRMHTDHVDWTLRAREAGARLDVQDRVLARRRRHANNMSRVEETVFDEYFVLLKAKLDRSRGA
jgi:glycosyltransferase involved in cell wall biosynthesis